MKTVFCKTGRPEIANDVMGVHQTDVWVILHNRHDWPMAKTRDELIAEISGKLNASVSGVGFGFTQPIEMRVDELVAGVKADVAVSLYGDDLQILGDKAKEIEPVLRQIPGGADVKVDYSREYVHRHNSSATRSVGSVRNDRPRGYRSRGVTWRLACWCRFRRTSASAGNVATFGALA